MSLLSSTKGLIDSFPHLINRRTLSMPTRTERGCFYQKHANETVDNSIQQIPSRRIRGDLSYNHLFEDSSSVQMGVLNFTRGAHAAIALSVRIA